MTDNTELITKLRRYACSPMISFCTAQMFEEAAAKLEKAQAEIERLKEEIGSLNKKYPCTVDVGNNCLVYARSLDDYDNLIADISSEAVKEFAEKLKEKEDCEEIILEDGDEIFYTYVTIEDIDNLLKEMVGD